MIFQTYIIWSNRTHSLKYEKSTTLKSKDIGIRKSSFVAKTQFLITAHVKFRCLINKSWIFMTETTLKNSREKYIQNRNIFLKNVELTPTLYTLWCSEDHQHRILNNRQFWIVLIFKNFVEHKMIAIWCWKYIKISNTLF